MRNTIEINVPDIGDFGEVEVIEVLVAEGDTVDVEQSLITVESDKASMEIPSSGAGVVKSLKTRVGDKVKEGSLILVLETQQEAAPAASKDSAAPKSSTASKDSGAASPASAAAPAAGSSQPAPATASSGSVTVSVPDIGDVTDVEVIEIMVAVGDTIAVDQSLITLESDKASMEVPSSHRSEERRVRKECVSTCRTRW